MKKFTLLAVLLLALSLVCICIQERNVFSYSSLDSSLLQSEVAGEDNVVSDNVPISTPQPADQPQEKVRADICKEVALIFPEEIGEAEEIVEEKPLTVPTDSINLELNEYGLELPINGATGYASISLPLYSSSLQEAIITTLEPGTAFQILDEESDMWFVNVNGTLGYVQHAYCLINLPDVIPSMVYDNTNSYSSIYRSVGYPLEGITDEVLYDATCYNERFSENQYLMPVLYAMSKKICAAQNIALRNGQCLKLYEGFRPFKTQTSICKALGDLMDSNDEVNSYINNYPWGKGWFISTGISNHQRGCAIDVSLVNISSAEFKSCGNYSYLQVTGYEEFEMPTQMHELSSLAVAFAFPVDSKSKTDWESSTLSDSMNDAAITLQKYCTSSGLTPLASEWWHFNDLDARESVGQNSSKGDFFITESYSRIPD